jgi:hypothetical protein
MHFYDVPPWDSSVAVTATWTRASDNAWAVLETVHAKEPSDTLHFTHDVFGWQFSQFFLGSRARPKIQESKDSLAIRIETDSSTDIYLLRKH